MKLDRNIIIITGVLLSVFIISCTGDGITASGNNPPVCNIVYPANNEAFLAGRDIEVLVNASDSDGIVTEVKFYFDGQLVCSDSLAPYECVIGTAGFEGGDYLLKVTAFDNDGGSASREANIRIVELEDARIWVASPLRDIRMVTNDKTSVDITEVFDIYPRSMGGITVDHASGNTSMLLSGLSQDPSTWRIYLEIESRNNTGVSFISVTAECEAGTAAYTLIVKIDDPSYQIFEAGNFYSFSPENSFGKEGEWASAVNFDLGSNEYELIELEFGYIYSGSAEWKIVEFDGTIGTDPIGDLHGTESFTGGKTSYGGHGKSSLMTGSVALVFKTENNFMAMDPSGSGRMSWIWSESSGWTRPELISPDYSGAWYIRMVVKDIATGKQLVIET